MTATLLADILRIEDLDSPGAYRGRLIPRPRAKRERRIPIIERGLALRVPGVVHSLLARAGLWRLGRDGPRNGAILGIPTVRLPV